MKLFLILLLVISVTVLLFRKYKGRSQLKKEFSQEEYDRHYKAKEAGLVNILGPIHEYVGHAIIPFQVGGNVDMYYFPNSINGTGMATMELIEPDGSGPKPNRIGTYELVAFTRHNIPPGQEKIEGDPFNKIARRLCAIMTSVGFYSFDAVLNPGETCELPGDEQESGPCILLDEYRPEGVEFMIEGKKHCLLLCMEIFRSEMEYAMKNGSKSVMDKLKAAGHWPYSDLDRDAVC